MEGCYFREGDRYRSRMSLGRGELNQPCECLGRAFWAEEKARGKDFKSAISLGYVKLGAGQCDCTRVSKAEKGEEDGTTGHKKEVYSIYGKKALEGFGQGSDRAALCLKPCSQAARWRVPYRGMETGSLVSIQGER